MGQRIRRREDQKRGPGLALNQDFAKGRGLEQKLKTSKLENAMIKVV